MGNMLKNKILTDAGNKKDYTLAIISNYPLEGYLKKGYDWLFFYYNPLGFFGSLHLFEPGNEKTVIMKKPYTLYIHRTLDYGDVRKAFNKYKIDCIRTYEMYSFDLAKRLSEEFGVPLVVSIH